MKQQNFAKAEPLLERALPLFISNGNNRSGPVKTAILLEKCYLLEHKPDAAKDLHKRFPQLFSGSVSP